MVDLVQVGRAGRDGGGTRGREDERADGSGRGSWTHGSPVR
jgi:hypothetical protein